MEKELLIPIKFDMLSAYPLTYAGKTAISCKLCPISGVYFFTVQKVLRNGIVLEHERIGRFYSKGYTHLSQGEIVAVRAEWKEKSNGDNVFSFNIL
jgi:hypothetical protein